MVGVKQCSGIMLYYTYTLPEGESMVMRNNNSAVNAHSKSVHCTAELLFPISEFKHAFTFWLHNYASVYVCMYVCM